MAHGIFPTYLRILGLAWKQYIARFDLILWINVLVAAPLFILVDWSMPRTLLQTIGPMQSASLVEWFSRSNELADIVVHPAFITHLGIQFIVKLCLVYITCVITLMLKHHYFRRAWQWRPLCLEALYFFPRAIVTTFLVQLMIGLGYVLFVLPGVVLEIILTLAVPMLVWYNISPIRAIGRALRLGFYNWWFVLSYIIITQLIVEAASAIVIAALPDQFGFVAAGLTITNIFASFTTVFVVLLVSVMNGTPPRASKPQSAAPAS